MQAQAYQTVGNQPTQGRCRITATPIIGNAASKPYMIGVASQTGRIVCVLPNKQVIYDRQTTLTGAAVTRRDDTVKGQLQPRQISIVIDQIPAFALFPNGFAQNPSSLILEFLVNKTRVSRDRMSAQYIVWEASDAGRVLWRGGSMYIYSMDGRPLDVVDYHNWSVDLNPIY